MKILSRVLLALASLIIAVPITRYVSSFTSLPVGHGLFEATPVTLVVVVTAYPLSAMTLFLVGDMFLNRWRTEQTK